MNSELILNEDSVSYDGKTIVEDVSFTLNTGEIGCLLGPSGCGKTTLLRAIAGFEPISQGEIVLREQLAHEVRKLLNQNGMTAILVTHDQLDAYAMSDIIGVVGDGRLR